MICVLVVFPIWTHNVWMVFHRLNYVWTLLVLCQDIHIWWILVDLSTCFPDLNSHKCLKWCFIDWINVVDFLSFCHGIHFWRILVDSCTLFSCLNSQKSVWKSTSLDWVCADFFQVICHCIHFLMDFSWFKYLFFVFEFTEMYVWKVFHWFELCMDSFSPCHVFTFEDFSWLWCTCFRIWARRNVCVKRYFIDWIYMGFFKELCQGMHFWRF